MTKKELTKVGLRRKIITWEQENLPRDEWSTFNEKVALVEDIFNGALDKLDPRWGVEKERIPVRRRTPAPLPEIKAAPVDDPIVTRLLKVQDELAAIIKEIRRQG